MNCKNCGAEIAEGSVFCGNCGMKIVEENTYEEPVQGEYQPPVVPEYTAQPISNEKPNTVLWIVLAAVEIFTCCGLTGIVSLIYAILGHVAAEKGDLVDAASKVKTAKIWFWVGLGLGIVFVIIYFLLVMIGLAGSFGEAIYY